MPSEANNASPTRRSIPPVISRRTFKGLAPKWKHILLYVIIIDIIIYYYCYYYEYHYLYY